MNEPVTAETIRSIIAERMEDTERADRIMAAIRNHDGKKVDKRLAAKLGVEAGEAVEVDRDYGMLHLVFGGRGSDQLRFTINSIGGDGTIDADRVEQSNICYLAAAKERNQLRGEALVDPETRARLATAINSINEEWRFIQDTIGYGKPFNPDGYAIEKLIDDGLRRRGG